MNITKCDSCKKVIKTREQMISAGIGYWPSAQLCMSCGKPVRDFLAKRKLMKQEGKKVKRYESKR